MVLAASIQPMTIQHPEALNFQHVAYSRVILSDALSIVIDTALLQRLQSGSALLMVGHLTISNQISHL